MKQDNEEDYKKVDASCFIKVLCHCPYCDAYEDVFDEAREVMDEYHSAKKCDIEYTCSGCGKIFIIENIHY